MTESEYLAECGRRQEREDAKMAREAEDREQLIADRAATMTRERAEELLAEDRREAAAQDAEHARSQRYAPAPLNSSNVDHIAARRRLARAD